MDSDADWAANALFSPSKARIAQAQARDWGFVDSWLAKRYGGKRLPTFERHEATLEALLTLATLNESADEQKLAVDRVEQSALLGLEKQHAGPSEDIYQAILRHFDHRGDENLEILAKTMLVLDAPANATVASLACSSVNLQTECFDLAQQQAHLNDQKAASQREGNRLKLLLRELRDETFLPASELIAQTTEWSKGSKHLKAKIGEYDDRLGALRSAGKPPLTVEQVAKQSESLRAQESRLTGLEAELKVYQSLPTNAREARATLEDLRDELRRLTQKRDRLFEGLVQSG